jgi:hypothetical protein
VRSQRVIFAAILSQSRATTPGCRPFDGLKGYVMMKQLLIAMTAILLGGVGVEALASARLVDRGGYAAARTDMSVGSGSPKPASEHWPDHGDRDYGSFCSNERHNVVCD